jgi:Flp pilus assembly pilin Flp
MPLFHHFLVMLKAPSGATAIEYCLLAALIALVILAALAATGNALDCELQTITSQLSRSRPPKC